MPSNDTRWVIGTIIVAAGLLSAQISGVNTRIDDVNANLTARIDDVNANLTAQIDNVNVNLTAQIDNVNINLTAQIDVLRDDMRGLDGRLRAVEVAFGKVDQRLATLERAVIPAAGE